MALTQAQAALLSNDLVTRGVIEAIVVMSPVLQVLPFMDLVGTAITFPREATLAAAQFNNVGGTWSEGVPTVSQGTATLKILGGDADIDNFLQRTYANVNDLASVILFEKAKAVAYQFNQTFWLGDTGVDANSFDGLKKLIAAAAGTQTVTAGTNGAALTLAMVDQLIDAVRPGPPVGLFMSRRTRRNLNALRRAQGAQLQEEINEFGMFVSYYDGIPIYIDENIPDNDAVGTSGAICSAMYAFATGFESGVMGIQNGGIQVVDVGNLETKDAMRHRIKWYCGMTNFRDIAAARLIGINGT
jgi:hypothetical protein